MKYCKKAFAAALVIFIFFSILSPAAVRAADNTTRFGREKLGQMSNGANLQYVYDRIADGCSQAKTEFQIDISGRGLDINNDPGLVFTLFYSDYPEYFWVSGSWDASCSQLGSSVILTMMPTYTVTGSALTSAKTAYDAKVSQLTAGLSGSDYDKAKTLHDRLIDTTTYASSTNDQNAYGALVEGKAVCNGYARAYQHLLMKAGIPAWYVNGTSTNPSTGTSVGHAWNLVEIDGQWYYTDVTWDDQGANTFYAYFNITTQQLLEGHTLAGEFTSLVPTATATEANYYVKEDRIFTTYDQAKLVSLLKKDSNKTQIYVTGNMDSFILSLNANLISLAADLGATGSYSVSYSISSLGKAMILDVIITQKGHTHSVRQTVQQADPSCLTPGTKTYYICDCGLKFLDQSCTQQVTSDSQLEIEAIDHTPSDWKHDAASHWKECTQCGTEIANTRGAHTDGNGDSQCDTCSYGLPVKNPESSTPGTEPAGTTATEPAGTTATEPAGTTATEPTGTTATEPAGSTQPTVPTNNETVPTTESTQVTEPTVSTEVSVPTQPSAADPTVPGETTDGTKAPSSDPAPLPWAGIIGAAVAVVGIGGLVIVIIKKKSK